MKFAYRRMSILLVDPASVTVDSMESYLEPLEFYRIWSAKTAEEAMQVMRGRPVDLVVTNWKLQPINGLQLVEMVRRDPKLRPMPVVVLLNPKDKHIEEKARAVGASALANLPPEARRAGSHRPEPGAGRPARWPGAHPPGAPGLHPSRRLLPLLRPSAP